nr:unnamed protein product [Spirometra erinaceieuropaei]
MFRRISSTAFGAKQNVALTDLHFRDGVHPWLSESEDRLRFLSNLISSAASPLFRTQQTHETEALLMTAVSSLSTSEAAWDLLAGKRGFNDVNIARVNEDHFKSLLLQRTAGWSEQRSLELLQSFIARTLQSTDPPSFPSAITADIFSIYLSFHVSQFSRSLPVSMAPSVRQLLLRTDDRSRLVHTLLELLCEAKHNRGDFLLAILRDCDGPLRAEFTRQVCHLPDAWRPESYGVLTFLFATKLSSLESSAHALPAAAVAAFHRHHTEESAQKSAQFASLLLAFLKANCTEIPRGCHGLLREIASTHKSFLSRSLLSTIESL